MGTFTTRVRYSNPYDRLDSLSRYSCFGDADYIYSWRSRGSKYDLSDAESGNNVGIRMPQRSGNLIDVLADRKRFTEDIMTTMGGSKSNALPATQMPYRLTTDVGHPFTSVKFRTLSVGRYVNKSASSGLVIDDTPVFARTLAEIPTEITSTPGLTSTRLSGPLATPSVLERNARLSPVFANMLPTQQVAQVGETVVSLLRGEFPTLIRNLSKALKELRRIQDIPRSSAKYAGREYLNVTFGWKPLISDFENAIRVLTTVDRLIYGTAYRRKRTISWPTVYTEEADMSRLFTSTAYGGSASSVSSQAIRRDMAPYLLTSRSYDARLSARLVPIARPGIGANKFIDEAVEQMEKIGLWYPALGWDLLPYSWLIDWFTSLGSAINNASRYGSKPGQTNVDYAWITTCTKTLTIGGFRRVGVFPNGSLTHSASGYMKNMTVSKTRFSSSPFGVGLDLSGLNPGQIAIMVALGLSKIR